MKPRNAYLTLGVASGLFLLLMAVIAMPAAAWDCPPPFTCGDHHSGTCPDGLVCQVTGQDCHQVYVPPVYGSCNECPKVWVDTSHWSTCTECGGGYHCDSGSCHTGQPGYQSCNPSGSCNSGFQKWIVEGHWDYGTCPEQGYVSCDGPHHEKQLITPGHFETQCQDNYGCRACPDGQHKDGDNLCVPDVCGIDYTCGEGQHCNGDNTACIGNPVCQDIRGTWIWTYHYGGDWIHTMIISTYDPITGAFGGTGYYTADPSYTWAVTGTVTGNDVIFTIVYTGNPGYTVDSTGTFDGCQFASGTAGGDGQVATWELVPYVPPVQSSGVLPACYQQDVFQNTQLAPSCQGLGTLPTIPLISLDGEQLYISVTHDGPFSVQKVAHDPEPDLLYNEDCTAVNYFKNSCNIERLCSGGGTLSFTDKGTRDFTITARPNFNGDPRPFQITVTNHFVDFSATTPGPSLDMHFVRTMDTTSCRYWLNGIPMFTGI